MIPKIWLITNKIQDLIIEIPNGIYFIIATILLFAIFVFFTKKIIKKKLSYINYIDNITYIIILLFLISLFPEFLNKPIDILSEKLSAFGPLITALVIGRFSVLQCYVMKKQTDIAKHQSFVQRTSFISSEFIKEKQNKIIELRKKYIDFINMCNIFLRVIFPISITTKVYLPNGLPNLSIDNAENVHGIYFKNVEMKEIDSKTENYIIEGYKKSFVLLEFLNKNEVFFANNKDLYNDLTTISNAFYEMFKDIWYDGRKRYSALILKEKLNNFLEKCDSSSCIFVESFKYFASIKQFRNYFYNFMHDRFNLNRNNKIDNLLYMVDNSIFKTNNLIYDEASINLWCENEVVAFMTYGIIKAWFDTWLNCIDDNFRVSFGDVVLILDNEKLIFSDEVGEIK